jgi:hypothetical protein
MGRDSRFSGLLAAGADVVSREQPKANKENAATPARTAAPDLLRLRG